MKRKLSNEDMQQRDKLIHYYAEKRYSANQIQKKLQEQGLGIRRKELLAKVREVKGVPKKPNPEVYIPIKYRRAEKKGIPAKWIAVYGSVDGTSRRIELAGSGKQLYKAMLHVAKHPPKKRFVQCGATDVSNYLDYEKMWDERPKVKS